MEITNSQIVCGPSFRTDRTGFSAKWVRFTRRETENKGKACGAFAELGKHWWDVERYRRPASVCLISEHSPHYVDPTQLPFVSLTSRFNAFRCNLQLSIRYSKLACCHLVFTVCSSTAFLDTRGFTTTSLSVWRGSNDHKFWLVRQLIFWSYPEFNLKIRASLTSRLAKKNMPSLIGAVSKQ